MSLSRIISDAIEANEADGTINRQGAINVAVPLILADEELTEMCVRGHTSKLITSSSKKRTRESANASPEQIGLFGLRDRYTLENEEGNIKRTEALTRSEFKSIIALRQNQVNADLAHLDRLRRAEFETQAIWDAHPDWTWGNVEAEYSRTQAKRAPSAAAA